MAYPDDLLVAGETVVVHTRPHPKRLVGPVLALLLAVAVATYLAVLTGATGSGLLVLAVLAAAVVVWLTVVPVARWWTTHLVLTDRRLLMREGILTQQDIDLPKRSIESARYTQTFTDRLLGSGTLAVATAGGEPLELDDVPDVQRVYGLLYRRPGDA